MRNFNIFRVHGNIRVLEGGFTKKQYIEEGGLPKMGKGGRSARTISRFKGGLARKEEVVFLRGVDIPMHTMYT